LIGSPRPPKLVPILFGENDKGEKAWCTIDNSTSNLQVILIFEIGG